ncbi:MAG: glycosyltransferase family 1 protein [Thermoflexales bacterium]
MMRITLDAHGIARFGGGRTYALPLLRTMASLFPTAEFDVWLEAREPDLDGLPNVIQNVLPIANRFLARLALQAAMPVLSSRRRSNATHFMKNLTVLGTGGVGIVTIHDLHPVVDPVVYPASDVLYWRSVQPKALRQIDRIIAVSHHTKNDLVRLYKIDPDKIDVIYHGVDPGFRPRSEHEVAGTLIRYGLKAGYVLHVGAISPKKNIETLVRAFAALRADGYSGQLLLVGPVYEKLAGVPLERLRRETGLGDALIVAGRVSDADVKDLMAGAALFVFPSMYEGFGLAVAEAMASGVPVIAARAGAVAEVVKDAAPLVEDGRDAVELARQMGDLLANSDRRAAVARACLDRSAIFRWEVAARETISVYEKSIRENRLPH